MESLPSIRPRKGMDMTMIRRVVTDEAELRRLIARAARGVRSLDELYRRVVRMAVVDLDDLARILDVELRRAAARQRRMALR